MRYDSYRQKGKIANFPVVCKDKRVVSSLAMSEILQEIPTVAVDYVFICKEKRREAEKWLQEKRGEIIMPAREEDE